MHLLSWACKAAYGNSDIEHLVGFVEGLRVVPAARMENTSVSSALVCNAITYEATKLLRTHPLCDTKAYFNDRPAL